MISHAIEYDIMHDIVRVAGHSRPPGRGPCALAALKLLVPTLLDSDMDWRSNGSPRPGPQARPRVQPPTGPRTDSDGTSHLAFTSAHSGSDCAWTRLPRNLPPEDPPMGPDMASEFSTSDPRGSRPNGVKFHVKAGTGCGSRTVTKPRFYYR